MKDSFYSRTGKRIFDRVGALAILAFLSPVLLLVSLAVLVESGGPVFYRQERIGRHGRPYRLFKFRSMVVGAEQMGAGILVERGDARITGVGKFIRRLSLDEIPQLFNVVLGHMSLVGPRPGLRYQVELYDNRQRDRLLVRPGVTGWAQVNGRNAIDWGRRIELDLEYLRMVSLRKDILIMFKTIPTVLRGGDMIAGADYWKERARQRAKAERRGREGSENDV